MKRARDAARHLAGELKSLTRDASEKEAENKLLEEGLSEAIAAAGAPPLSASTVRRRPAAGAARAAAASGRLGGASLASGRCFAPKRVRLSARIVSGVAGCKT